MSKVKITVIVLACVLVVSIVGVGVVTGIFFGTGRDFSKFGNLFAGGGLEIDEELPFDMQGIESVVIAAEAADVRLNPSEGNNAALSGEIFGVSRQDILFAVEKQGDTLYITVKKKNKFFNFSWGNLTLDVNIMPGFTGDMDIETVSGEVTVDAAMPREFKTFGVRTTSGDITVPGRINADSIKIGSVSGSIALPRAKTGEAGLSTVSGELKVRDLSAGSIYMTTTSGKITANDIVSAGDMTVKSVSGDLMLKDVTADEIRIDVKSGKANIERYTGDMWIDGISSGIYISTYVAPCFPEVDITTVSGEVALKFIGPEDETACGGFHLNAATVSGNIRCDYDITVKGDVSDLNVMKSIDGDYEAGGRNIRIQTVSGDIAILKK